MQCALIVASNANVNAERNTGNGFTLPQISANANNVEAHLSLNADEDRNPVDAPNAGGVNQSALFQQLGTAQIAALSLLCDRTRDRESTAMTAELIGPANTPRPVNRKPQALSLRY